MSTSVDPHYPGPEPLGRGVVVSAGAAPPPGTPPGTSRIRIDDEAVKHPSPVVARLHLAWVRREPVVVELATDNDSLREPQVTEAAPWDLPHGFTFERDRLHFLLWANNYDARSGEPIWWHGELARRRGGQPSEVADVLVDEVHAWADGGPRGLVDGVTDALLDGAGLVHRESIQLGRLTVMQWPHHVKNEASQAEPTQSLAPDQHAAVVHASGPARIIAPAGSGKTRVLTARMRHLHASGYERSLVTAVAYNTRAAAEMRERLGEDTRNVRTFHSLGKYICDLDRSRELIDERQQRSLLDRLVRTARIPNTDPFQAYLDALALVRLGLVDPLSAGLAFELDDFDDTFTRYRAELDRRNLIDFDEMIFRALELLLTRPDIRERAGRLATHLLVDEFQDLTPAFHLLLRLVASPALQVFGVGDDDQVIYGYAGADPAYLIDFARDFPGAGEHPLTVNYRCPPAVVDQVTTLLGHNARRVAKVITAGRDEPGDQVEVHAVATGAMASRATAIVTDRLEAGATPSDIAVLARVNATLLPVQVTLAIADIPHTKVLDVGVLQRTGIRTAFAYLRLGMDPERMRREDIVETLNRPARKVKSAVTDHLRGRRFSIDQLAAISPVLSATHADRWDAYLGDIMALSDAITDGADTSGCLRLIRTRIGLGEAMDTLDASRSRPEGSSHGDDLDALAQLAMLHEDPATFADWLRDQLARPGDDKGVTLSTVHRVKGMEWDHVIVHAGNAGLFPHRLADDIEEERRVFHVAVTRCRETVAVVSDRESLSPFVDELRTPTPASGRRPPPPTDPITARVVDGRVGAVAGTVITAPGDVAATVVRIEAVAGGHRVVLDVEGVAAHLPLGAAVTVDGQPATLTRPSRAGRSPLTSAKAKDGSPSQAMPGTSGGSASFGRSGRLGTSGPDAAGSKDGPFGRGSDPTGSHGGPFGGGRDQNGRPGSNPGDDEIVLTPEAQARFEALRGWRTERARDQAVPPYVVFHDRHLKAIAAAAPTDLIELARCPGVGATKLDRYGDDIIALMDELT